MNDLLRDLNSRQLEAITSTEGPVLVIAGPGSGKTRVLTHRVAYLIAKGITKPGNILAVTFTNKAAREMQDRIRPMLKIEYPRFSFNTPLLFSPVPTIGTFHSVCVRILRAEAESLGFKKDFVIFDEDDQLALVKTAMKELNISKEQMNPNFARNWISSAKNELKKPSECENMAEDYISENLSKIYAIYQDRLHASSAFDFDDLIMKTIILFETKPEILKRYQSVFKYIMVDEYQDTNFAQYRLIDLLGRAHGNICVVGDDWQSIYRWRGADIANILEFEKNYPDAKVVKLEQNYRSTQLILDAAYGVISKNINRKDKKLWTERGGGSQVVAYEAADEKGEADFVIGEIAKLYNGSYGNKVELSDIAILYRTNAQSRSIEEAFLKYNVPYRIVGGIKFYLRKEIKDVVAYLRFIQNPFDVMSFERIVNIPQRGAGKATLAKIAMEARKSGKSFIETIESFSGAGITKNKMEALKDFARSVRKMEAKNEKTKTLEFLDLVIKEAEYQKYVCDGTEEGEVRWENVKELYTALGKYNEFPWKDGIRMFLEEVSLATDLDNVKDEEKSVTLMTLHSAKGLEYDTVFMIGMEEGLLPHSRSIDDPAEMEEERRLCYVGITRAKSRVYLVYARVRRIYGSTQINNPSRFITDIPEHLVEMKNQGYSYLRDATDDGYRDEGYEEESVDIW
ncbi:MAG: UvrD-helicase domain-containing protein [Candidatus Paceibacterota bacterium]|jgi:DNA helicase-2/ATP-dependent DNA helicase PcrA